MTHEVNAELGSLRVHEIYSFVVLAEELHFANAAGRLQVTPGGLSRRIAHLERALGGQLLERTTRMVRLTPYGHGFVPTARRLTQDLAALQGGFHLAPDRS